jgi:hypothetical protein
MTAQEDREPRVPPPAPPAPDLEDQLSPSRALRESAARGGGQRIGNNGPVANPEVSFPDEPPGAEEPASS